MSKIFEIGDVIKIYDSSGYYRAHPLRKTPHILIKSEVVDEFPKGEEVTVIGFQVLNGDDRCVILRRNRKCYWISLNFLCRGKREGKGFLIFKKTNRRKRRDIEKRYWGSING